jgi:hypothetical protein
MNSHTRQLALPQLVCLQWHMQLEVSPFVPHIPVELLSLCHPMPRHDRRDVVQHNSPLWPLVSTHEIGPDHPEQRSRVQEPRVVEWRCKREPDFLSPSMMRVRVMVG